MPSTLRGTDPWQRLQIESKNGGLLVLASGYSQWTPAAEDVAAARHLLETVLRQPILVKPLKKARSHARRARNATGRPAAA